jgi:chromate reductase, NAD(P)H dehydrogenase (quinone)
MNKHAIERPRILLVPGSMRERSTNMAALRAAHDLGREEGSTALFTGLADLPLFSPDDDYEPLPEAVAELRGEIALADGVLFSTPEYMGTLPGAFKNLLEWTVGGPEMDGKPVSWINVAPEGRGEGAQEALRTVLGYLGARASGSAGWRVFVPRKFVGEDGRIVDGEVRAAIGDALLSFAAELSGTGITAPAGP